MATEREDFDSIEIRLSGVVEQRQTGNPRLYNLNYNL
jgi:hypothetical protein